MDRNSAFQYMEDERKLEAVIADFELMEERDTLLFIDSVPFVAYGSVTPIGALSSQFAHLHSPSYIAMMLTGIVDDSLYDDERIVPLRKESAVLGWDGRRTHRVDAISRKIPVIPGMPSTRATDFKEGMLDADYGRSVSCMDDVSVAPVYGAR